MSVQLLHDFISRDTSEAAKIIKEGVDSGDIVGMVFALQLRGRRYAVNVAGQCARDPTFARGMCGAIDDELREMIQGRAASDTTI